MAKKRRKQSKGSAGAPASLREEASGVKPTAARSGGAKNAKSVLKLQHLQKLAVWAAGEGSVPSLEAFFGRRLAAVGESFVAPPILLWSPVRDVKQFFSPGTTARSETPKSAVQVPCNSESIARAVNGISEASSTIGRGEEESPATPLTKLLMQRGGREIGRGLRNRQKLKVQMSKEAQVLLLARGGENHGSALRKLLRAVNVIGISLT